MNNKEFKDLIMQMNAFRRMDEQEKKADIRYAILLGVLFLLLPILGGVLAAVLQNKLIGVLIAVCSIAAGVFVGLRKRQSIFSDFWCVSEAEMSVQLIKELTPEVLDMLYQEKALCAVMPHSRNYQYFLYCWLISRGFWQKDEKHTIYLVNGRGVNDHFRLNMDEKAEVLCFLLDLSKLDEVKEDRLKREMSILKIGFFQDTIENFNQEKKQGSR